MKKTTMYFADKEAEELARHAREIGISFAEMVRRVIAEWLAARQDGYPTGRMTTKERVGV